MNVTGVVVRRCQSKADPDLCAYADVIVDDSLTLCGFRIVRVAGDGGRRLMIRFPDRSVRVECSRCQSTIGCTDVYCPRCGQKQPDRLLDRTAGGKPKRHESVVYARDRLLSAQIVQRVTDAFVASGPHLGPQMYRFDGDTRAGSGPRVVAEMFPAGLR